MSNIKEFVSTKVIKYLKKRDGCDKQIEFYKECIRKLVEHHHQREDVDIIRFYVCDVCGVLIDGLNDELFWICERIGCSVTMCDDCDDKNDVWRHNIYNTNHEYDEWYCSKKCYDVKYKEF